MLHCAALLLYLSSFTLFSRGPHPWILSHCDNRHLIFFECFNLFKFDASIAFRRIASFQFSSIYYVSTQISDVRMLTCSQSNSKQTKRNLSETNHIEDNNTTHNKVPVYDAYVVHPWFVFEKFLIKKALWITYIHVCPFFFGTNTLITFRINRNI